MAQDDQTLRIGAYDLRLPPEHNLPAILQKHPQYDRLYWDIIGALLAENALTDTCQLIDIGANIGDSAAHFRRHATGPVWAIEAHPGYFTYLQANTAKMGDVTCTQALVAPPALAAKVSLDIHDGTGATRLDSTGPFQGQTLSPAKLMAGARSPCMIKSDTDGFDGRIISALIPKMQATAIWPAIVTFEGPRLDQVENNEPARHHAALTALMQHGYTVQILTNTGLPVAYLGASTQALDWHMRSHRTSVQAGVPAAHYFDYICIAPGLNTQTLTFAPDGPIRL